MGFGGRNPDRNTEELEGGTRKSVYVHMAKMPVASL